MCVHAVCVLCVHLYALYVCCVLVHLCAHRVCVLYACAVVRVSWWGERIWGESAELVEYEVSIKAGMRRTKKCDWQT